MLKNQLGLKTRESVYLYSAISQISSQQQIQNQEKNLIGQDLSPGYTFFQLFIRTFNLGIMALPFILKETGFVMGIGLIIFSLIIIIYSNDNLLELVRNLQINQPRFSQILTICLGKCFGKFMSFLLVIVQLGLCSITVLFLAEVIKTHLCLTDEAESFCKNQILAITIAILFISFLSFFRGIHTCNSITIAGYSIVVFSAILMILYAIIKIVTNGIQLNNYVDGKIEKAPQYLGVCLFIFFEINYFYEIWYSLNPSSRLKYFGLTVGAVCLASVFILVFAISYVLVYGEKIQNLAYQNLPKDEFIRHISLLFTIGVLISYPSFLFPLLINIEYLFLNKDSQLIVYSVYLSDSINKYQLDLYDNKRPSIEEHLNNNNDGAGAGAGGSGGGIKSPSLKKQNASQFAKQQQQQQQNDVIKYGAYNVILRIIIVLLVAILSFLILDVISALTYFGYLGVGLFQIVVPSLANIINDNGKNPFRKIINYMLIFSITMLLIIGFYFATNDVLTNWKNLLT